MKRESAIILGAAILIGGLTGCRSQQPKTSQPMAIVQQRIGGGTQYIPKAMVYRTNGDYFDNVPVTLNVDRTKVLSYPAPTDLSEHSLPVRLPNGWLLDRRGVGPYSVFTSYTYKEYMALPQAPSSEEILAHVIPDSEVTGLVELPITVSTAVADPSLCDSYIKSGFTDCRIFVEPK